jgi:hypothetical protein
VATRILSCSVKWFGVRRRTRIEQPNQAFSLFVPKVRFDPLTNEREIYLQGNADEQDNLIQRILADWNQMIPLDPAALRWLLLELQDEICDE